MMHLEFTRADDPHIENLNSLILEAYADGELVANILCVNGKWQVILNPPSGGIALPWATFLEISRRFSEFIAEESELWVNQAIIQNGKSEK